MLPTDPRWLAMNDADIIRESWRWHYLDLMRAGQRLPEGSAITEFEGDDTDFEEWVDDLEETVAEQSLIEQAGSESWEQVE